MPQITVHSDRLTIQAGQFARSWELGPRGATTTSLRVGDWNVPLIAPAPATPECFYDGLLRHTLNRGQPDYPALRLKGIEGPVAGRGPVFEGEHECVSAVWEEPYQMASLGRSWRVYPGGEAIVTRAEISSESAPLLDFGLTDYLNVVDSLPIDLTGWEVCAVGLWGRSDYTNDVVRHQRRRIEKTDPPILLRGNLFFLEPPGGGRGLFILVESPPEDEKRPETAGDLRIGPEGVQVLGWGLRPEDILPDRRRRSYAVAIGGYRGGESARLHTLRTFLKRYYPPAPAFQTIVANPWGEGAWHEHLCEKFVLQEMEACADLGLTHYQLDDGWEVGQAVEMLTRNAARTDSYWDIAPEKFPRGFAPLVELGKKLGVQPALWFAPDFNRHYRNWRQDSDAVLDLYRRYGINLFKIDFIWLRTKEAEENITAFLESVHRESGGQIQFNPDVTASRRQGHFALLRYGNLFLENRYVRQGQTEFANTYLPWWVLRNLWNFSRYLPAERLQIDVPNCHKPCFKSAEEIARNFEMKRCADDYLAAIALAASPLYWGEPSALPTPARTEMRRVFALHRTISGELAASHVLPIGAEPTGRQWTGFQVTKPDSAAGLLLAFREANDSDHFEFELPYGLECKAPAWECLSHPGAPLPASSGRRALVRITQPNDFRLFRYRPAHR